MRQLTALQCDPIWAVFNRELVTTAAIAPWLLYYAVGDRTLWPSGRTLVRLLLVGLLIEVVGNVGAQWAFGVVGLAITIPAIYGVVLVAGAVLGRLWLREHVSRRSAGAIALVLASLVLLGIGAEAAGLAIAAADAVPPNPLTLVLGVAVGGLAGGTFALLGLTIRHSVTRTTRPIAIAFLVPLMGVVSLGPLSVYRLGVPSLLGTPWEQFALMGVAGVFNLVGFLAIIHGLQRTTVAHANVLSASQIALAAAVGIVMFHEPPNPWLLLGIGLTIVGILRFDRPADGGGL